MTFPWENLSLHGSVQDQVTLGNHYLRDDNANFVAILDEALFLGRPEIELLDLHVCVSLRRWDIQIFLAILCLVLIGLSLNFPDFKSI